MKIWSDTFSAETALEHSFYNKTEEAEKEFKKIMEAIKSVVEDRTTNKTIIELDKKRLYDINEKHFKKLGYGISYVLDKSEVDHIVISW